MNKQNPKSLRDKLTTISVVAHLIRIYEFIEKHKATLLEWLSYLYALCETLKI